MTALQRQLELYREQVESWKIDHETAMACRDIEDAIELGLAILNSIRRHADNWAREVEHDSTRFSWEASQEIAEQFRWWLENSSVLLNAIEVVEGQNYYPTGADGFRKAHREVSLMCLDVGEAQESIEALERGEGVPANQAINELRDRIRSRDS